LTNSCGIKVNRVRVPTVEDLFIKRVCIENEQIGNTDAENVKGKKNARIEVGDCNRQVLRRE
jgi:hypothetical protein